MKDRLTRSSWKVCLGVAFQKFENGRISMQEVVAPTQFLQHNPDRRSGGERPLFTDSHCRTA